MADTESSPPAEPGKGGVGGSHRGQTQTPPHLRSELASMLKILEHHGARGIPIPEQLVKAATAAAAQALGSQFERVRAAGFRFIQSALTLNLDLVVQADRMARLDGGMPTERQEVVRDTGMDVIDMATKDPALMRALLDAVRKPKPAPDKPA